MYNEEVKNPAPSMLQAVSYLFDLSDANVIYSSFLYIEITKIFTFYFRKALFMGFLVFGSSFTLCELAVSITALNGLKRRYEAQILSYTTSSNISLEDNSIAK